MMRIDSIASRPDRVGKYKVLFSDGFSMPLYRQTIEDFGLYNGMEINQELLQKIKVAAGKMSAKMRAVRIVSATNVSKGDLERRLVQKGESAEDAQMAVAWMAELDLLDDRKTAEQIVNRCISKGYGIHRARQALYEKRIPKQYWQDALVNYPDQSDAIGSYLRTHLDENSDTKQVRRVIDSLIRKGHNYIEIRHQLQNMSLSGDFPEE